MKTVSINHSTATREQHHGSTHTLISWGAIFSGLVIALITYAVLISLGIGFGGSSAANMIQDGGEVKALAMGAAIWIGLSVLISLAVGSYFAARTSTFVTGRMGGAQGVVIGALFFGLMLASAGQAVGFAGKGLAGMMGAIGVGAGSLAANQTVQTAVENGIGATNLKSEPSIVVKGLITRLIQGDSEAAKAYLANQTGLSSEELDAKYAEVEGKFKAVARDVGVKTADAVSASAWMMYWILLAGIAASALSGAFGTRRNFKKPVVEKDTERHGRAAS